MGRERNVCMATPDAANGSGNFFDGRFETVRKVDHLAGPVVEGRGQFTSNSNVSFRPQVNRKNAISPAE